jgi:hypothetical protein
MSAKVRRTIAISLSPARIAQTDDPARPATIGIDAGENETLDDPDCPDPYLAIVSPAIDLFDDRSRKQLNRERKGQTAP